MSILGVMLGSGATATAPTYAVTPSTTSVNEGGQVVFSISTTNVSDGTTLYWTNAGTTVAGDFTENTLSGSFTITSGAGSVTLNLNNDLTTEGSETIIFQVRTGSIGGTVQATASTVTVNDTSTTPTYAIAPNTTNLNEGATVTWTVTTTGFGSGTLYWTNSGSTVAGDFTANVNEGSISISGDTGSLALTLSEDRLTEGGETVIINLRTGSTGGTIVATAATVTVNDTSLTRTYSITPNVTSQTEGLSVAWNVSTSNVPNGTTLYADETNGSNSNDYTTLTDLWDVPVVINSGVGSFTRTLRSDSEIEGDEVFIVRLKDDLGNQVAVAPGVTIFSTSPAVTGSVSVYVDNGSGYVPGTSVNETGQLAMRIRVNGTPEGYGMYWTQSGTANLITQVTTAWGGDGLVGPAPGRGYFTTWGQDAANTPPGGNGENIEMFFETSQTTEGNQTIIFQVRRGSYTNPVLFTSPTVTLVDNVLSAVPRAFPLTYYFQAGGGSGGIGRFTPRYIIPALEGGGGGAGGGGAVQTTVIMPATFSAGYTVGATQGRSVHNQKRNGNPTNMPAAPITAIGGGAGAPRHPSARSGNPGGGGGGGAGGNLNQTFGTGGTGSGAGSGGQGRWGNFSGPEMYGFGAGGGGASPQSGQSAVVSGSPQSINGVGRAGNGGIGRIMPFPNVGDWMGDAQRSGGGGGGGGAHDAGIGGIGGGGNGSWTNADDAWWENGGGGGGAGEDWGDGRDGGGGGSQGFIIIRYQSVSGSERLTVSSPQHDTGHVPGPTALTSFMYHSSRASGTIQNANTPDKD